MPPRIWPLPVAALLVFLLAQGLSLVFLIVLALVRAPGPVRLEDFAVRLQEAAFSPAGFLGSVVLSAGPLAGAALLGARLSRETWRERLRVRPAAVRPHHLVLAVLGMLGLGQILDSILALKGWGDAGMLGMMADAVAAMSWPVMAAAVLVLGLVAGTAEELFFRGFVQTRLSQRWGPHWAVALTALLFGAFHCDVFHSPTAAVMGLYLGWLTERVGSVLPAIAAHVVNNALYVPLVAFGPEDLSPSTHLKVMAASGVVAALAMATLARAYPPAAVRPAAVRPAGAADASPPPPDSLA